MFHERVSNILYIPYLLSAYPRLENVKGLFRYSRRHLLMNSAGVVLPIEHDEIEIHRNIQWLREKGIGPKKVIQIQDYESDLSSLSGAFIILNEIKNGKKVKFFQPTEIEEGWVEHWQQVADQHVLGIDVRSHIVGLDAKKTQQFNNKVFMRQQAPEGACVPYIFCQNTEHLLIGIESFLARYKTVFVRHVNEASAFSAEVLTSAADAEKYIKNYGNSKYGYLIEPFCEKVEDFSNQFLITDREITYLGFTRQVMEEDKKTHKGNDLVVNGGAMCEKETEMYNITLPIAKRYLELGFEGVLGFDSMEIYPTIGLLPHGRSIAVCEANARETATTPLFALGQRLKAEAGNKQQVYVSLRMHTDVKNTKLKGFSDIINQFGENAFNGTVGIIPILSSLLTQNKCGTVVVAHSKEELDSYNTCITKTLNTPFAST